MSRRTARTETNGHEALLSPGLVLRPPVTLADLKRDTENDPEGAEEFVELIRTLRKEGSRSVRI